MIKITEKEVYSTEGKYVHRIGTEAYFKRCSKLPNDTEGMFEEVDTIPDAELVETKNSKIAEITAYDISEAVNSFTLNDSQVWYDKATRVSIKNQIESRQMLGQETAPIEFGGTVLQIPIEQGLGMLAQLEVYASDCYNRTALHKAAVSQLTTKEEVESYDYTTGYPEKLKFEL